MAKRIKKVKDEPKTMGAATVAYRGKVNIAYQKNGKIIKSKTHNTGLPDMALLFAKAISGNFKTADDAPRLIDVGYEKLINGNIIWNSILNTPVNIMGRQYSYDSNLQNWIASLVATIYYSDINGAVLDEVLDAALNEEIQLKARLCSYPTRERKYYAEIEMSPDDLSNIRDATSAIFTWYTELLYAEDGFTNVEREENVHLLVGNE